MNRAKKESPEAPRLLYIFPTRDSFSRDFNIVFDYFNNPVAQKNVLTKFDIGLEILPDSKNLERYFDLFPPSEQSVDDSILLESLRKIASRDSQGDPFKDFQLDEESLKALEEAAEYLASDNKSSDDSSNSFDEESEE